MIPSRPPPRLSEPEKWSREFNDFVAQCLTKNATERPTADDLLKVQSPALRLSWFSACGLPCTQVFAVLMGRR
jgi:serine/threonine protein kinase